MKNIIWQVLIYILVTLIITIVIAVFQDQLYQIFKLEILNFEKIEGAPIILPQLSPAIAFLLVIIFIKDVRHSINVNFNSIIALKSLLALILPIFLASIIFIISNFFGIEPKLSSDSLPSIAIALVTVLIGALGEETGWRGFLQPLIEKNTSALIASVLVGLLWGLWHVGHYKNGWLFMLAFLLFTISASIIVAWLYRDTKFSVIIPILFHTSINFCFFMMFKNSLADYKFMSITAIVWMIPAICIILIDGKKLIK